jgi:hypothetical protein
MANDKLLDTLRDLAREHPLEVEVHGGCMEPLLIDGARVKVAPARFYWPGDVIVFRAADGRLLAHRLLGYRPLHGRLACVTRGDGCVVADAPVPLSQVLGRAAVAGPSGRFLAVAGWLRLVVRRLVRRRER